MLLKRLKRVVSRINLSWHVAVFAGILIVLALPLLDVWRLVLPERVIGVDGGFLANLILVPVLIGFVLYVFSRRADDLERHMRKFENE